MSFSNMLEILKEKNIGIPEARIEYYLEKLARLDVAYIVYCFDSKKEELIEKYRSDGSYHKEKSENKNYLICVGIRGYPKDDKYLVAIQRMQEYMQYMLEIIFKLPRVEKFSIGNEYKISMYETRH